MTITRVGSTRQYAEGWELAFGKRKAAKKRAGGASRAASGKAGAKTQAAKSAKKKAASGGRCGAGRAKAAAKANKTGKKGKK